MPDMKLVPGVMRVLGLPQNRKPLTIQPTNHYRGLYLPLSKRTYSCVLLLSKPLQLVNSITLIAICI